MITFPYGMIIVGFEVGRKQPSKLLYPTVTSLRFNLKTGTTTAVISRSKLTMPAVRRTSECTSN